MSILDNEFFKAQDTPHPNVGYPLPLQLGPPSWFRVLECCLCRERWSGMRTIQATAPSPEATEYKVAWLAETYRWRKVGNEWRCGAHDGPAKGTKFVLAKTRCTPG